MSKEVRSPNSLERNQFHPQRGISPGSRSSPSNARADWGHAAPRIGKSASQLVSARRDGAVPVQGGWRSPVDPRGDR